MNTNRNSMGATPSMARATSRTLALLPAQGRQRDGPRQHDPAPPRPPGHPPGGAARGPPPPPPPPPGWSAGGGQPHDRGRLRSPGSDAPATSRGLSRGPQAAPHRGGGGEPRLDPPRSPNPSHRPASQGDAGPHPPPGSGSDPPSPRQDRGARRGGRSRARLHAPAVCSRRHRDGQANPGAKGATRTAPGNSTRTRTGTVWGPRPPWPERRPEHPLCCLPREGRGTDRGKATPGLTSPLVAQTGGNAHRPPPPHPNPQRGNAPGRAGPPHGGRTAPSQVGGKREQAPSPPKGNKQRKKKQNKPHGTGAGSVEADGPSATALPVPSTRTARSARATPAEEGGGERVRRRSARAHTHKGHAGRTRRATGPSPRNAQTAWNGVPASEGKGHPDGTARHTQRGTRGAGRGKREGHDTRHQPDPPEPAASAAHTRTGHCTRQGSSGAPRHAPGPRLGSLRASPRGSTGDNPVARTRRRQGPGRPHIRGARRWVSACSYGC